MKSTRSLYLACAAWLSACPAPLGSLDASGPDARRAAVDAAGGTDAAAIDSGPGHDAATPGDAVAVDDGASRDAATGADTPTAPDATSDDAAAPGGQLCASISDSIRAATGTTTRVAPGPPGQVLLGATATTLRQVVQDAQAGDTILLADGTYTFFAADTGHGAYTGVYVTTPDLTLRSESGNAGAVILDSGYVEHGGLSAVITIDAAGVVLADFTVKRSVSHLVHFWSNADDVQLHNLVLEDGGQQFVKASGTNIDRATVSCSRFVMTAAGRANVWGYGATDGGTRCYTGGIDTHAARSWHVHDNRFEGIFCDATPHPAHGLAEATYTGGLAEHAIHMWDAPAGAGHLVERNQILDCARGIGIGMAADVYDTVVRNNMVFSAHAGSGEHDVGINVERGHGLQVDHNTVFFASPAAYPNAIEYRFASSDLWLRNNLTNKQIAARDGATATLQGNVSSAQASWFVDAAAGDLHLRSCDLAEVAGQGVAISSVTDDVDQQPRSGSVDVGADQCAP